jgi:phosphoserine phosphatase RsbU/P
MKIKPAPVEEQTEVCGKEVTTDSDKRIIHLVDDAPANIQAANYTLKTHTYIITIAKSATIALDLEKVLAQPDLILLDVSYAVCSRLKADSGTCEFPSVFSLAKTSAEDETRGFELGAIDYIHKAFEPLVVQARVRTHLALRESREQLAEEKRKGDRLLEKATRLWLNL